MSNKINIGISLDMINRHHQEPNRNRCESKYFWEELYPLIVSAGFNAVEIPYDPFWMFRGGTGVPMTKYCIEAKYGNVKQYAGYLAEQGIEKIAGIHFDPSMFMRNDSLEFYFGASGHFAGEAIRFGGELGCDYVNVTPTPPYGLVNHYHGKVNDLAAFIPDFLKRTAEWINGLAETARQSGVTLTLGNEYWSLLRGDAIVDFLKQLDASVRLNADAAHISVGGGDPVATVKDRAALIGSVHLTDTAFVDADETWKQPNPQFPARRATQVFRDLGQGAIDLPGFYNALTENDYRGWAIVSCRQTRDPMRALLRSRHRIDNCILAGTGEK